MKRLIFVFKGTNKEFKEYLEHMKKHLVGTLKIKKVVIK